MASTGPPWRCDPLDLRQRLDELILQEFVARVDRDNSCPSRRILRRVGGQRREHRQVERLRLAAPGARADHRRGGSRAQQVAPDVLGRLVLEPRESKFALAWLVSIARSACSSGGASGCAAPRASSTAAIGRSRRGKRRGCATTRKSLTSSGAARHDRRGRSWRLRAISLTLSANRVR